MATYNSYVLDLYFKTRNWSGAADYLSTLKAKGPQEQVILNNKIKELRKQGEKQAALLQNMNTEQQDAFNFISAVDGVGILPQNNPYTSKYTELINDLKVTRDSYSPKNRNVKGENIKTIRLDIWDDASFNQYLGNIGTTRENISSLGLSVRQNNSDGHWLVDVPVNNLNVAKYISAARSLTPVAPAGGGTGGGGYPTGIPDFYTIKALTQSNIIVDEEDFNINNIFEANAIIDDARKLQNKAIEDQQTISLQEDIVVTPFLGHGHANAYKRMARGAISIDDYNKIVEERTEVYNTLLRQAGLQNNDVFVASDFDGEYDDKGNEVKGKIFQQIDAKDKDKIMEQILVAMDDKRLTYSAAMHEGEVGTYITISPKVDSNGNPVIGYYGQGMRIFIPGLFKSSCDESFNADTKQMSVRENADMRRWNYGKFLKNGEYVGYDKEIGAYKIDTDESGNQIKVPITTEEILQRLNEENIIDSSVSTLLSNIDEEGNPLQYTSNGTTYTYDIEERAQTLANVATNELYPKGKYTDGERLRHANDIYNTIMSELSKNFYKQKEEE